MNSMPAMQADEEPVIVGEFAFEPEVEVARSILEAAGLRAAVTGNHALGAGLELGGRGGFQLVVPASEAATARALLEPVTLPKPTTSSIPCPRCGSASVVYDLPSRRAIRLRAMVRWLVALRSYHPQIPAHPRHLCGSCGFRW
jgi:hypothetical protein